MIIIVITIISLWGASAHRGAGHRPDRFHPRAILLNVMVIMIMIMIIITIMIMMTMMMIKAHHHINHQGRRRTHHPRSAGQLMELNKPQPRWWYFIIKIDEKHDYVDFDDDNDDFDVDNDDDGNDDFDENSSGPRGCWIWWLENNFHNQVSSPYLLPFYHFVAIFAMLLQLLSLCYHFCHICRHFCHCIDIFTIFFHFTILS